VSCLPVKITQHLYWAIVHITSYVRNVCETWVEEWRRTMELNLNSPVNFIELHITVCFIAVCWCLLPVSSSDELYNAVIALLAVRGLLDTYTADLQIDVEINSEPVNSASRRLRNWFLRPTVSQRMKIVLIYRGNRVETSEKQASSMSHL